MHQVTLLQMAQLSGATIDQAALARYEEGEGSLRDALGLSSPQIEALKQQAMALVQSTKFAEAWAILELLQALDGLNAGGATLAATCLQKLGRLVEGQEYFQLAVQMAEDEQDAQLIEELERVRAEFENSSKAEVKS